MIATVRFKSGHKVSIKCNDVKIKYGSDGNLSSYEFIRVISNKKDGWPLYMNMKEVESVTYKLNFIEKIKCMLKIS
jgi:hypothetical protein